jgi:hypothetical protein
MKNVPKYHVTHKWSFKEEAFSLELLSSRLVHSLQRPKAKASMASS